MKTAVDAKNGKGASGMGSAARNNGVFSSKWTHLPIGVPYWNGGWAGGQPQLSDLAEKNPFFRANKSPPPMASKENRGKYEPSSDRVMF